MTDKRTELARRLYWAMPGAPTVPADDAGNGPLLWGEVEKTDHWAFCWILAGEIVRNSTIVEVSHD